MPQILKRNAVIVFGLCSLFYWSFRFAKHNPALRDVIPFGDDHMMPLARLLSSWEC